MNRQKIPRGGGPPRGPLTLVVFISITLPLVVHTQQLLLRITPFQTEFAFISHAYALFFALAFDLSVFHFAQQGERKVSLVFAWIVFFINFLYWTLDILFIELPASGWADPLLWAKVVIGTTFSAVSAFLIYRCSELLSRHKILKGARRGGKKFEENGQPLPHRSASPTDKDKERVILLREGGHSIREITKLTGVAKSTVGDIIRSNQN